MKTIRLALIAAAIGLGGLTSAQAASVSIGFAPGTLYNASAIADVTVGSAAMAGMRVQMCFFNAGCETADWTSGTIGASGGDFLNNNGWRFQAGSTDTFEEPFVVSVAGRQLQSFSLYGLDARTVFDTVFDQALAANQPPGLSSSPGSGNGRPFTVISGDTNISSIAVNYFDKVYVGNTDYDDLYLGMQVSLSMNTGFNGFTGQLRFSTDTDRVPTNGTITAIDPGDPGTPAPEPATLALVGVALLGVAASRRRRS